MTQKTKKKDNKLMIRVISVFLALLMVSGAVAALLQTF